MYLSTSALATPAIDGTALPSLLLRTIHDIFKKYDMILEN